MNLNDLKDWIKTPPPLPEWRPSKDSKTLREWRKKNKLSQNKLGKILGVGYMTVWLLEKGQRNPSGPMVRLLQLIGVLKS